MINLKKTAILRCFASSAILLFFPLLPESQGADFKVVGYVPNWISLESFSQKIDYAKLTHLNIAFENPVDDSGTMSFDLGDATLIAKAHANRVKVLVSIGGGSASGDKAMMARYFSLLSDTNRARFVLRLADYVIEHDFDGVDVDIEGPSINADYEAFVHELAMCLKKKDKLLTAALSQGYGGEKVPKSVFGDLDFVNIMAYDGTGPWSPNSPGQHSSFDYATNNVAYWLKRGLLKEKAVLGVPFYGYGFGKAFRRDDFSYAKILRGYPGAENKDQVGETIYYNGISTIRAKSRYVVDQGLAGVMIWSLDGDVPGERSLLAAICGALCSTNKGRVIEPNTGH